MVSGDLRIWLNHFDYHAEHPRQVPPEFSDRLTTEERQLIASSIAIFQLGEQSEGFILLQATQRFARVHQLPQLVRIVELLVREEQHHAGMLRLFMGDHRIAPQSRHRTASVFHCAQHLAGLEFYLHVLICAQMIGKVYYRALESATGCQRLKVLCRILVCEELAHIGFESQLLLSLSASRPVPVRVLMRLVHRIFVAGAASVVWFTHRPVLRRAGYSLSSFLRNCVSQYVFYLEPAATAAVRASLR